MALSKPSKERGNVQAHLSLTPEHLMPLLQGVRNWWKGGDYGRVMAVPNPSYMPASSAGGVRQPAPPYETVLPVTSQPTPSTSSAVLTPSPPPSKRLCNRAGGMAERPKLPELYCFRSGDECVNIIEKISTNYSQFGIFLLEDNDGDKMAAIIEQYGEDATKINRQVLSRWIKGEGKQPVSWATLASELERCGLTVLAKTIRTSKSK